MDLCITFLIYVPFNHIAKKIFTQCFFMTIVDVMSARIRAFNINIKGWDKEVLMKKYGGKHLNVYCVNKLLSCAKRKATRLIALLVASFCLIPIALCGQIALGFDQLPGYFYNQSDTLPIFKEKHNFKLAPIPNYSNSAFYTRYCVESTETYSMLAHGSWYDQPYDDYRIAAKLINSYKYINDDFNQASIAYAIHDHLDSDKNLWQTVVKNGFEGVETDKLADKAKSMWESARASTPTTLEIQNEYTNGKRTGVLHLALRNADKEFVYGTKIKVTSDDNRVKFGSVPGSVEVTSDNKVIDIPWSAKEEGTAKVTASYEAPKVERFYSSESQDYIRTESDRAYETSESFNVRKDFYPVLTSKMNKHKLRANEKVDSEVKVAIPGKDDWPNKLNLHAQGYYFVGSDDAILHIDKPGNNESAQKYLQRIREVKNLRQVAAAEADFSNADEKVLPKAKRASGDINSADLKNAADYKVGNEEVGKFGTWVWVIAREAQNEDAANMLEDDIVQVFGSADTTAVHQSAVKASVTAKQKTFSVGSEIAGEIAVEGLPESYGLFKGNGNYGFDGDKDAHIRVWWAGAGTENPTKQDNDAYDPAKNSTSGAEEPTKDDHHRLVGEWDVPAVNGVYEIGNGNITVKPAAVDGKPATEARILKENVHIRADNNKQSGWYVFVYDFPGSSRAVEYKSAYNNSQSRVLVEPTSSNNSTSTTTVTGNGNSQSPSAPGGTSGGASQSGGTNSGGSQYGGASQSGSSQTGGSSHSGGSTQGGASSTTQPGAHDSGNSAVSASTGSNPTGNAGNVSGAGSAGGAGSSGNAGGAGNAGHAGSAGNNTSGNASGVTSGGTSQSGGSQSGGSQSGGSQSGGSSHSGGSAQGGASGSTQPGAHDSGNSVVSASTGSNPTGHAGSAGNVSGAGHAGNAGNAGNASGAGSAGNTVSSNDGNKNLQNNYAHSNYESSNSEHSNYESSKREEKKYADSTADTEDANDSNGKLSNNSSKQASFAAYGFDLGKEIVMSIGRMFGLHFDSNKGDSKSSHKAYKNESQHADSVPGDENDNVTDKAYGNETDNKTNGESRKNLTKDAAGAFGKKSDKKSRSICSKNPQSANCNTAKYGKFTKSTSPNATGNNFSESKTNEVSNNNNELDAADSVESYVDGQESKAPSDLAVTGSSAMIVILIAVITLMCASGLCVGRFVNFAAQNGRATFRSGRRTIPPMRRRRL